VQAVLAHELGHLKVRLAMHQSETDMPAASILYTVLSVCNIFRADRAGAG